MNRQTWKDLLEAIGFAAIIASLIFLAIETRNSTRQAELNTQAIEISAYQDLMNNIAEMNALTASNPEVSRIMFKAWNTDEAFTEEEEFIFSRLSWIRFRHGDMAYFQFERGVIDETRLRSALMPLNLGNPRTQNAWPSHRSSFVQGYQDFIDMLIEEETESANQP